MNPDRLAEIQRAAARLNTELAASWASTVAEIDNLTAALAGLRGFCVEQYEQTPAPDTAEN